MSNRFPKNLLAGLCAVALLFAVVAAVDAQTADPILDDEILCSITAGDVTCVAPIDLQSELETAYGQTATVESMPALLQHLAAAGSANSVRFEGAQPSAAFVQGLEGKGYLMQVVLATPLLPSAPVAYRRTR